MTFFRFALIFVVLLIISEPSHAINYSLPDDIGSGPFADCSGSGPSYSCSSEIRLTKTARVTLSETITLVITDGGFIAEKVFSISDNGFKLNLEVVKGDVVFVHNTDYFGDITVGDGNLTFEKSTDFVGDIHTDNGNVQVTNKNSNFVGDITTSNGNVEITDGSTVVGACSPQDSDGDVSCSGGSVGGTVVDHYEIIHNATGLTCNPEDIVIAACENADCSLLSSGIATVTLGPSGWVGGDTFAITGSETLKLRHVTPETVSLAILSQDPTPTNDYRCTNSLGGSIVSCSMTFYDSGFSFTIPTQTSCKDSDPIIITAVRRDDVTKRCVPAFANRTEDISFWSTYVNPTSGAETLSVNGTGVVGSSPGTDISLTFDVNGQASLLISYPDAGLVKLDARYEGSGDEAGLTMLGDSSFVTGPAGLCVYSDQVDSDCVSMDGTCSAFVAAGTTFDLKIGGVCWQVDGESDQDFCDNAFTPNFQISNIILSHNLMAPISGVPGTIEITTLDINSNGVGLVNQSVSEVGVFTFTAAPPSDYLGTGDVFGGATFTSANIGRLIPDHFDVAILPEPPVFAETCLVYSYLGEPFDWENVPTLTITAKNGAATPITAENYEGDFWKLDKTINYNYLDANVPVAASPLTPQSSSQTLSEADILDCGGTITFDVIEDDGISGNGVRDGFKYIRPLPESPVAPFEPDVGLTIIGTELSDYDSVCYDRGTGCEDFQVTGITGLHVQHGRGFAGSVFGPETNPLVMPVSTYIYDDSIWLENGDDNCTAFSYSIPSSGITVAVTPSGPITMIGGFANLTLTPSAGTSRENVPVTCTFPSWLAPDSTGVATFGISRGNDRIINWQEIIR